MQAASPSFLRRSPTRATLPTPDGALPAQASVQPPLQTPPQILPARDRHARAQHDAAIEVLWVLVLAVASHQLRQSLALPQDRGTRESWTWWALDITVGLLLRALMNAVSERAGAARAQGEDLCGAGESDRTPERVLAPAATPRVTEESPPRSASPAAKRQATRSLDQLESLLEEANAQPRKGERLEREVRRILAHQQHHARAISLGEATWSVARLSQGALALPASTSASELAAFSAATTCLIAPAKAAHSRRLISDEEWQMAADHLERQVFERLAPCPPALLGAALAEVRTQLGKPR